MNICKQYTKYILFLAKKPKRKKKNNSKSCSKNEHWAKCGARICEPTCLDIGADSASRFGRPTAFGCILNAPGRDETIGRSCGKRCICKKNRYR